MKHIELADEFSATGFQATAHQCYGTIYHFAKWLVEEKGIEDVKLVVGYGFDPIFCTNDFYHWKTK